MCEVSKPRFFASCIFLITTLQIFAHAPVRGSRKPFVYEQKWYLLNFLEHADKRIGIGILFPVV